MLWRVGIFEDLADATVQIALPDGSRGSGFHYRSDRLVITNRHVVGDAPDCIVVAENGHSVQAEVVARSTNSDEDWAVLVLNAHPLHGRRRIIRASSTHAKRGDEVLFAGYPHGIPDLLTHRATVSGPSRTNGFHIDGSVNGGNSGGPIIDAHSGELVGIVTARRFISGQSLAAQADRAQQLISAAHSYAQSGGSVMMLGVDVGQLYLHIGEAATLAYNVAVNDANSGIGIGYHADPAVAAAETVPLP